jgi:glycosyltransferase involved in cell wall biosynthesis
VVQRGTALDVYSKVAHDVVAVRGLTRFDNTRYSHYRGVRWLVLLREFFHFPFTLIELAIAKMRWKRVDIIHVNEVTELVPGLLAKALFRAPLIVHVRSLLRVDAASLRCRWLDKRLRKDVNEVIAIDSNVRMTLPPDLPVTVVHNSFTFEESPKQDLTMIAKIDAMSPSALKVGFVGNLHRSKGLFDLVEAARRVAEVRKDVSYVVVGGVARRDKGLLALILERLGLAQDAGARLVERIEEYGLSDAFHFLGATKDIQCIYERIDVLCFPSRFDSPGRPVFEAAFAAVPSIVAVSNPMSDTLIPGVTGMAVRSGDPTDLAEAILYFADNRAEAARMGANALQLAQANFDPQANAIQLLDVYRRAVGMRIESGERAPT